MPALREADVPTVGETVERSYNATVTTRGTGTEGDPIRMKFSAGDTVDAHGTVFRMEGADLSRFRSNPVVRWAHGKDEAVGRMPVARATKIRARSGDLVADLDFDEQDRAAQKIESKLRRGFLNAGSIAAEPKAPPVERRVGGEQALVFTDWELRGISIVDIPSDPDALAVSRGATGAGPVPRAKAKRAAQAAAAALCARRKAEKSKVRQAIRREVQRRKSEKEHEDTGAPTALQRGKSRQHRIAKIIS